jgi:hypothetical protein
VTADVQDGRVLDVSLSDDLDAVSTITRVESVKHQLSLDNLCVR